MIDNFNTEEIGVPMFEHSYIAPCTFLGSFNGKDLYHAILKHGDIMLIERNSSKYLDFYAEEAKNASTYYLHDVEKDSWLGEAYRRSLKLNLPLGNVVIL